MKLLATCLFLSITLGSNAQLDRFFGIYYTAALNTDEQVIVEENCWTHEIDEIQLHSAETEGYTVELVFNSFHTAVLYGNATVESDSVVLLDVYDPDMLEEDAEISYESYRLKIQSNGTLLLTEVGSENVYLLLPTKDLERVEFVECPEEVEEPEGEE